jgi:hypothetical protein
MVRTFVVNRALKDRSIMRFTSINWPELGFSTL